MSFWAVELLPGKEQTTNPEFDLIVTQAVLPEAAKDKSRTVVSVKSGDLETPFAVAALTLGSHESQQLSVYLDQGVDVTFINHGKNPVHLIGRYHEEPDYEGMYGSEDEFGSEGEEGFSGSEEEGDEDIDEDELARQIEQQGKKRAADAAANGAKGGKGAQQPPAKKQKGSEGAAVPAPAKPAAPAKPQNPPAQQKAKAPAQQKSPQKAVQLAGGMSYEVLKGGSGPVATRGKRVNVKYVGRLPNGKVFDSSTKKPFSFKLGGGEVIRGWDLGVEGMSVGEKRKLIIPPELAYGKRGAPPEIPPNATLHFDVEFLG